MSFLRNPAALFALNLTTLIGVLGSTYTLRSHMVELSEDHEARMDELEGTLRGQIGLIEDALERLEGELNGNKMDHYHGKELRTRRKCSRQTKSDLSTLDRLYDKEQKPNLGAMIGLENKVSL
ncbi:hypothetical protein EAF04_007613 [Stromatinia cepivora]|nr:hypothetical protein EAF04_007613 [Stromatinia cepivora]